jgi:uncharacterized delta-60 repeat protein
VRHRSGFPVAGPPIGGGRSPALLLAGLSALLLAGAAVAAGGALDTSFGKGGRVTTSFAGYGDTAYAVAIQRDGKIVAAGSGDGGPHFAFVLARYAKNGALDTSFGRGGKVRTSFPGKLDDGASAVGIQRDGKIVAAGSHATGRNSSDFALARYNPDGSLDTSFGKGGMVTTSVGASSFAQALVIQPDGKIVAAGLGGPSKGPQAFALVRYNPDGSLDTSFGEGGMVTTGVGGSSFAQALVIQADGKIVAAGGGGKSHYAFVLARYTTNGSLDVSFGKGGTVSTRFAGSFDDEASAIGIQRNGKIVVAGSHATGRNSSDFALARYNPDGSLDTSFGKSGRVLTAFRGQATANALVIQSDGKIVSAGANASNSSGFGFMLARYLPDGSPDTSFGTGGKETTAFPGSSEANLYALAIQVDGRIVAAGETDQSSGWDFALARYLGR